MELGKLNQLPTGKLATQMTMMTVSTRLVEDVNMSKTVRMFVVPATRPSALVLKTGAMDSHLGQLVSPEVGVHSTTCVKVKFVLRVSAKQDQPYRANHVTPMTTRTATIKLVDASSL